MESDREQMMRCDAFGVTVGSISGRRPHQKTSYMQVNVDICSPSYYRLLEKLCSSWQGDDILLQSVQDACRWRGQLGLHPRPELWLALGRHCPMQLSRQ